MVNKKGTKTCENERAKNGGGEACQSETRSLPASSYRCIRIATEIARLIGRLVDLGISAQYAQMKGGAALGVVLLLNCVRTSLHYHVNAQTTETMFRNVRKRMFTALTCGRIAHIEGRFQTGEVVSRLNSDVGNLCEAIAGSFTW